MKTLAIAILGTSSIVASADAGFMGFVAFAKQSGSYVVVDVFTAVSNSSDKFLNVYNANITTTSAGGFYQAAGLANKTWKADVANFNSTRSSIDSFMTAGTYSGGAYGGEYYASPNTNADPNFCFPSNGNNWCNATPASAPATTVPANAGWYTGDPTSVDNNAELLNFLGYTRIDSGATPASDNTLGSAGSAGAQYGIWCSHMVIAGTLANVRIDYSASASIKDGMTGGTDQRISTFVIPAPGAIALLGVGGIAMRRRRG
jgi:hypothetical protein